MLTEHVISVQRVPQRRMLIRLIKTWNGGQVVSVVLKLFHIPKLTHVL